MNLGTVEGDKNSLSFSLKKGTFMVPEKVGNHYKGPYWENSKTKN